MAFARSTYRANYQQETNYDGPSYRRHRAGDHAQLPWRGKTSTEERTWGGRGDDARNRGPSEDGHRWRSRPQHVERTYMNSRDSLGGRGPSEDGHRWRSRPEHVERTSTNSRESLGGRGPSEDGNRWRSRPQNVERTSTNSRESLGGRGPSEDGNRWRSRPEHVERTSTHARDSVRGRGPSEDGHRWSRPQHVERTSTNSRESLGGRGPSEDGNRWRSRPEHVERTSTHARDSVRGRGPSEDGHRWSRPQHVERTSTYSRDSVGGRGPSEDGHRWSRPQHVARDGYNTRGRFPDGDWLSRHSRPGDVGRPSDRGYKGRRGPDREELSRLPHQPGDLWRHSARNGQHEGGRHRENGDLSWRRRPGDEERSSGRVPEPAPLVHARDSRSEHREHEDREGRDGPLSSTQIPASGPVVQEHPVEKESPPTPPPPVSNGGFTEEQVEKKSCAIIEEYLEIDDMTEAMQCVEELESAALLSVFVRRAMDTTLEHTSSAREQVGRLLQQLVKAGTLSSEQYLKGLREILDAAEDMAIDVPLIWLYLAELIAPMICDGGIPMGHLFREISTPLVSLGRAGVLLAPILQLLANQMTPQDVGALWTESGLRWEDFLSKDADVDLFIREQNLEFTAGELQLKESRAEGPRVQELSQHLSQLLRANTDQHQILDWLESNVDEEVAASNQFVAILMASLSQVAMEEDDAGRLRDRAALLQRFLVEEDKQLQALYALQVQMEELHHPNKLLRSIFDALYDADVVSHKVFCQWEVSDDPEQQEGKASALESVEPFFTWFHCDEDL